MGKKKIVKPVDIRRNGAIVPQFDATEESINWLQYGRLMERAKQGEEDAKKEAERMDNSLMCTFEDDNDVPNT
jgi:hypothetical protein